MNNRSRSELSQYVVFHSENGPGIGGSDFKCGKIADHLIEKGWSTSFLVNHSYPINKTTRRPHRIITTDGINHTPGTLAGPTNTVITKRNISQIAKSNLKFITPRMIKRIIGYRRDEVLFRKLLRQLELKAIFQAMDAGPQPSIIAAKQAGYITVSHYAAPPPANRDWLSVKYSKRSLRHSDICVFASQYNAEAWSKYMGFDINTKVIIYNGTALLNDTAAVRLKIREELNISTDAIVVGVTGRLNKEKGVSVFAKAACEVGKIYPDTHFVIVGSGSEEELMRDIMLRRAKLKNVHFLGFRMDSTVVVAAFDIAIVPSVFAEPFGMVVIEAMAAEAPVIASRTGGIPEIIQHNKNGVLVPPSDSEALSAAISDLIENRPKRLQLGLAGKQTVDQKFTIDRMLSEYVNLYQSLIDG